MKSRIVSLAAASAVAAVPGAHATTDPPDIADVHVKITDARISLDRRSAPRGNYARFIVRNIGAKTHSFTLGKGARGAGVQTGFNVTLRPRQKKILILYLDYRGKVPYYSRIKADLRKPGMKGVFTIL